MLVRKLQPWGTWAFEPSWLEHSSLEMLNLSWGHLHMCPGGLRIPRYSNLGRSQVISWGKHLNIKSTHFNVICKLKAHALGVRVSSVGRIQILKCLECCSLIAWWRLINGCPGGGCTWGKLEHLKKKKIDFNVSNVQLHTKSTFNQVLRQAREKHLRYEAR